MQKFAELKEKVQNKISEVVKERKIKQAAEKQIKQKQWEAYYNEKYAQAENYGIAAAREEERLKEAQMKKKVDNKIKLMEQSPIKQQSQFGAITESQADLFKPSQQWQGFLDQKQN